MCHMKVTLVMNILTNVRLVMTDLLVANCGLHGPNETEHLYNVIHYYGDTCALYIQYTDNWTVGPGLSILTGLSAQQELLSCMYSN